MDNREKPPLGEEASTVFTRPMDYRKAIEFIHDATSDAARDYTMKQLFMVCKAYIPSSLFKYYSLTEKESDNNKKLETLARSEVFAAANNTLNDPFDCHSTYYRRETVMNAFGFDPVEIVVDINRYIRVSSFTACNENSMPMWAHYASNHHGYCVEYDMTARENERLRACAYPVQYDDLRIDLTDFYIEQFKPVIDSSWRIRETGIYEPIRTTDNSLVYYMLLLCNIKHSTWSYEREFRCLVPDGSPSAPYIPAKPKAIYVGMSCSENNAKRLTEIAHSLEIPVYRMAFEGGTSKYLLGKKRIG